MKRRPDLLCAESPSDLEVVQLTEEEIPSSHLYMEAQIFTSDSRRLVVHRSASAHGSTQWDPEHQYLLCDLEDHCALSPLTDGVSVTGASVSPDDRYCYYFVNETQINGGTLTLKRVGLDGTGRETVCVVDSALPGTNYRPSRIYPLSTIRSDGGAIAISGYLGDGETEGAPYGLMVFDIEAGTVALVLEGPSWCNMHPQYCRSTAPELMHDLLIQENHDNVADAKGQITRLTGGDGADIHVIRDDGTDFRNMPWGRDGNEFCQGHQCWRGRTEWAMTSTSTRDVGEAQMIEGRACEFAGHVGINTPGGERNDLSRDFDSPQFHHFSTDMAGDRFITDSKPFDEGGGLWVSELGAAGTEAMRNWTYLLSPKSSCEKDTHIHPFLSPDGTMGFFNSDESGVLQAYMVRGF